MKNILCKRNKYKRGNWMVNHCEIDRIVLLGLDQLLMKISIWIVLGLIVRPRDKTFRNSMTRNIVSLRHLGSGLLTSVHSLILNLFSFTTQTHSWDILSSPCITKIGKVKWRGSRLAEKMVIKLRRVDEMQTGILRIKMIEIGRQKWHGRRTRERKRKEARW